MEVVPADDPRLDHVFQGVRQAFGGQCYREGRFKDGSVAYVDATDPRKFYLSEGSFQDATKHVIVVDSNGVARRCGNDMVA